MKERVELLKSLLPKLTGLNNTFANSLISKYFLYGILTESQLYWVGKLIDKATLDSQPQQHAANVGSFSGVVKLFQTAKKHLKYPKIVLHWEGKEIIFSLNGNASKYPGHISVKGPGPYGVAPYYGRVSLEGNWFPVNKIYLVELLKRFADDPADMAKKSAILTGKCCFCNALLTDPKSTAAGFGPICATHYGLSAEWKLATTVWAPIDSNEVSEIVTNSPEEAKVDAKAEDKAKVYESVWWSPTASSEYITSWYNQKLYGPYMKGVLDSISPSNSVYTEAVNSVYYPWKAELCGVCKKASPISVLDEVYVCGFCRKILEGKVSLMPTF